MAEHTFLTEKGKREKNEDYYANFKDEFFVVADGLGGRAAGEIASKVGVEAAIEAYKESKDPEKIFKSANEAIIKSAKKGKGESGMGTTMVSVQIDGKKAIFASVGDSRGYLLREGKLTPVTKDDRSKVGFLTAALGPTTKIDVHTYEKKVKDNDTILLCTDGLTNYVEDNVIEKILQEKKDLKKRAKGLVEVALQMESTDNVTVCLIKV